jgi:pimeloyl-ACP methyl ester carboxylesterase
MRFETDGHAIDYEIRGEGRAVIAVHGLTTDRRILVEACDALFAERGLRRVYLDLPGHGASTGNPARSSADSLVDALGAFVREVSPGEPPLLLAYAYAGYLAQALPRDVPLAGMCLVCPVVEADFGKRRVPPRRVSSRDPDLPFGGDERERDAFLEVAVHQTREALARFQRVVHPANISVDANFVGAVRARYAMARPYVQALASFDRPVAVACGRDDHWVGFEDAVAVVRACRAASLAVVADAGHLLPLEAPGPFRALVGEWLDRCAIKR